MACNLNEENTKEPEMVILRYLILSFLSEASKLLILAFIFQQKIGLFLFSVLLLFVLRSTVGGLHCKKYWQCLFVSFSYLLLCIEVLPGIVLSKPLMMGILLLCAVLACHIGPVVSKQRPQPTDTQRRKRKIQIFAVICLYLIFMYIVPHSSYAVSGFWVVVLDTVQLGLAEVKRKGGLGHGDIKAVSV